MKDPFAELIAELKRDLFELTEETSVVQPREEKSETMLKDVFPSHLQRENATQNDQSAYNDNLKGQGSDYYRAQQPSEIDADRFDFGRYEVNRSYEPPKNGHSNASSAEVASATASQARDQARVERVSTAERTDVTESHRHPQNRQLDDSPLPHSFTTQSASPTRLNDNTQNFQQTATRDGNHKQAVTGFTPLAENRPPRTTETTYATEGVVAEINPLYTQHDTQKESALHPDKTTEQPVIWRDPVDAATIRRQTTIIILQAIALLIVTGIAFFLIRRVPDRIVIDRSSGRVIQINNRDYGATEAVEMTPDNPGVPDRLYLAKTWCEWFFTIDRATRARQLERAFALMEPAGRRALARWLQERGQLDQERAESWQAIWKVLDAQADRRDPYLIRILGEQQISRLTHQANISAGLQTFRRQVNVTLKLVADPEGRADRNLRTGYLVAWVDARQVGSDEPVNINPVNQSPETQQNDTNAAKSAPNQPEPHNSGP